MTVFSVSLLVISFCRVFVLVCVSVVWRETVIGFCRSLTSCSVHLLFLASDICCLFLFVFVARAKPSPWLFPKAFLGQYVLYCVLRLCVCVWFSLYSRLVSWALRHRGLHVCVSRKHLVSFGFPLGLVYFYKLSSRPAIRPCSIIVSCRVRFHCIRLETVHRLLTSECVKYCQSCATRSHCI